MHDTTGEVVNSALRFEVAGRVYQGTILSRRGVHVPFKHVRVSAYKLTIPAAELTEMALHNAVRLVYVSSDDRWLRRRMKYSAFLRSAPTHRRGRLHKLAENDSVLYVRQNDECFMSITIRGRNTTDRLAESVKILIAKAASFVWRRRAVLVYEKQASQYEESGSVLFEEMVDRGRDDVRYLLASEMIHKVPGAVPRQGRAALLATALLLLLRGRRIHRN